MKKIFIKINAILLAVFMVFVNSVVYSYDEKQLFADSKERICEVKNSQGHENCKWKTFLVLSAIPAGAVMTAIAGGAVMMWIVAEGGSRGDRI